MKLGGAAILHMGWRSIANIIDWEAVIGRVYFAGQQGDRKKEECERGESGTM